MLSQFTTWVIISLLVIAVVIGVFYTSLKSEKTTTTSPSSDTRLDWEPGY